MTRIKINGTWFTVDWYNHIENICGDCYEWDRKEYIGNLGSSMRVYRLYAHGDECFLVVQHFSDGGEVEGIAGTPTKCDYEGVDE